MSGSWQRSLSPDLIVRVQAAQDALADLSGVCLSVLDRDGHSCTVASNEPAACFHARARGDTVDLCRSSILQAIRDASLGLQPAVFHCPLGLTGAIVPLGVSWDEAPCDPTFFLYIGRVGTQEEALPALRPTGLAGSPGDRPLCGTVSPTELTKLVDTVGEVFNLLFVLASNKGMAPRAPSLADERSMDASCLTRREREIVRLVGTGLSNQAIGARLFISEKTVKTHLTNALRKLNLTNRTELALYAVQALGKG